MVETGLMDRLEAAATEFNRRAGLAAACDIPIRIEVLSIRCGADPLPDLVVERGSPPGAPRYRTGPSGVGSGLLSAAAEVNRLATAARLQGIAVELVTDAGDGAPTLRVKAPQAVRPPGRPRVSATLQSSGSE
jgi:hypothetical protein